MADTISRDKINIDESLKEKGEGISRAFSGGPSFGDKVKRAFGYGEASEDEKKKARLEAMRKRRELGGGAEAGTTGPSGGQ